MSEGAPIDQGPRHVIVAANAEQRERIIAGCLNLFVVAEDRGHVVVLQRRAVPLEQAWEREDREYAKTWAGRLVRWISKLIAGYPMREERRSPGDWRDVQPVELPPGTQLIEVRTRGGAC